jgi:hypothetical protein
MLPVIEKNFTICPHCAAKGKERLLRPATHRTPYISRSDGKDFHLFLEDLVVRPAGGHNREVQELMALFRYDLDPAGQKAESSLVMIAPAADSSERVLAQLEEAADRLAAMLEKREHLVRLYEWKID